MRGRVRSSMTVLECFSRHHRLACARTSLYTGEGGMEHTNMYKYSGRTGTVTKV